MAYRTDNLPPEADRSILVVCINGKLIGLDASTGRELWTNGLKGGGYGEVFLEMRYGIIVASAAGAQVFRIDYHSGETIWSQPTQASGRASILVESDKIIVAKSGYLDCFAHDGRHLWSQPLKGHGVGKVAMGLPSNVVQADDVGSK